jgi:adenylyltransferase/sulfurtransferase
VLFGNDDVGHSKAATLAVSLSAMFPWIEIQHFNERIEDRHYFDNRGLAPDVLLSCVDSWQSRAILNRIAKDNEIMLLNGGTDPWSCNTYAYLPSSTPCLDCVYDVETKAENETENASCAMAEPSVVFTNMIAAGMMLWLLRDPSLARTGLLQYDLTIPERVGISKILNVYYECKCIQDECMSAID